MLTEPAAALDPFCLVRPVVSLQRIARHLASAAPDPAGAAGHPVHRSFSRFDQLLCSRWCGRQP